MKTNRTLDEIRRDGLAALRKRLGVAGMVRFLQQSEHGSGDYATERRRWVDNTSLEEIRLLVETARGGRKRRKAG